MKNIYLIVSILFFSGVAAGSCNALIEAKKAIDHYSEISGDTKIEESIMLNARERASSSKTYIHGFLQYVRGYLDAEARYNTSADQSVADTDKKYEEKISNIIQSCAKNPELHYMEVTGTVK